MSDETPDTEMLAIFEAANRTWQHERWQQFRDRLAPYLHRLADDIDRIQVQPPSDHGYLDDECAVTAQIFHTFHNGVNNVSSDINSMMSIAGEATIARKDPMKEVDRRRREKVVIAARALAKTPTSKARLAELREAIELADRTDA
jgi:hypothetical protein